jgi:acyl dehydratase
VWSEGDTLPARQVQITREQLVRYAGASGDFNPIHYDDERAKSFGLPGIIAHGMLNMGLIARVLTESAPEGATLERFGVRFRSMVRPGDTVTIAGKIVKVEADGARMRAHIDVALGVDPAAPAVSGQAVMVWPA